MQYFTQEYNQFFKELAANNHKEWFDENRQRYQKEVRKPFMKFIQDLILAIQELDPTLHLEAKNAVFRINNDIRFNKNKPLYKTHMGATISSHGRKNMEEPGYYIHLSPGECFLATGCYMPQKENLHKIRQGIAYEPVQFKQIITKKDFVNFYGGLANSEVNKVLPKELKKAAESEPILFNKQFYAMHQFADPEALIKSPELLATVMHGIQIGKPLNDFLKKCINFEA